MMDTEGYPSVDVIIFKEPDPQLVSCGDAFAPNGRCRPTISHHSL